MVISWLWHILSASLSFWEGVEYAGTAFVILGVVGEYLAEFWNWPKLEATRKRFERSSAAVLIIGLAVELLGLVRTSQLNGQLIATLNQQAQQATREAAIANETAKGFESQIAAANEKAKSAEAIVATADASSKEAVVKVANAEARITEANAKAAEAEKVAESERLERVKIEQRLQPRTLNSRLLPKVRESLRQFASTPYELGIDATPESNNLLHSIDALLRDSGWTPQNSADTRFRFVITLANGTKVEQGVYSGVIVQVARSHADKFERPATALGLALKELGLENVRLEYLADSDPSPDNIHVLVGTKD